MAKFFHYDVSWGGILALMRFCIFYAPWSLVTLAAIKFSEIYFFFLFFSLSLSLDKSFQGREKLFTLLSIDRIVKMGMETIDCELQHE